MTNINLKNGQITRSKGYVPTERSYMYHKEYLY